MAPFDVRIVGNLPTDWWNIGFTAGAVLIGAVIGAGISWLVARQTANENRKAAESNLRVSEEAATLRAIVKFMELVNSTAGYHLTNERTIAQGRATHSRPVKTWVVMLPQVGRPQEVHIAPDDLIAFTQSREFGFVTELLNACSAHNSLIYGMEEYGKRRDALVSRVTVEMMDRYIGGASWDDPELAPAMPYIMQVSDLADALCEEIKSLYEKVVGLQPQFQQIVRTFFNDPHFPVPGVNPPAAPLPEVANPSE